MVRWSLDLSRAPSIATGSTNDDPAMRHEMSSSRRGTHRMSSDMPPMTAHSMVLRLLAGPRRDPGNHSGPKRPRLLASLPGPLAGIAVRGPPASPGSGECRGEPSGSARVGPGGLAAGRSDLRRGIRVDQIDERRHRVGDPLDRRASLQDHGPRSADPCALPSHLLRSPALATFPPRGPLSCPADRASVPRRM